MIKRLLPLLLLILIGCSEPEPILISELYPKEDNVMYKLNSDKPYSGPVIGYIYDTFSFISQKESEDSKKNFEILNPGKEYKGHVTERYRFSDEQLEFKGQYNNGNRDGSWYYYFRQSPMDMNQSTKRLKLIQYYRDNKLYKVDFYSNKKIIGTYTYEDGEIVQRVP